jgi:hypothetical protein
MKTSFNKIACAALIALIAAVSFRAQSAGSAAPKDPMFFSVTLPDNWQSNVIRQDFENETIFSFNDGKGTPLFLFSITRVTGSQWVTLHSQLKNAMVVKNDGEFIYFIQRADVKSLKGMKSDDYNTLFQELNAVISSIQLHS